MIPYLALSVLTDASPSDGLCASVLKALQETPKTPSVVVQPQSSIYFMTLFQSTLSFGAFLIGLATALFSGRRQLMRYIPMLRARSLTACVHGAASLWFLWLILHLGPANFGDYKTLLFMGFSTVAILAYWYVPDFLSVRSGAVLGLLSAKVLLDSAYMQAPTSRLVLVSLTYCLIVICLVLGASPWLLRVFLQFLTHRPYLSCLCASVCGIFGLILVSLAFTY